jgi:kojibiose phosphorylase
MSVRNPTAHLRGWKIVAENPDAARLAYFESIMTLGNGLLGIRGSREEADPGPVARPMTLMAEVYDQPRCPPGLSAKYRSPSRLAPMPNPLFIDFDDGSGWLSAHGKGILSEKRTLDMKKGVIERVFRCQGRNGRITRIASRRLVSQARPHLVAIRYSITPENYSGAVSLRSLIDATATYPDHVPQTREQEQGVTDGTVWMRVQTRQSRTQVCAVARHLLTRGGRRMPADTAGVMADRKAGLALRFEAVRGRTTTLEKVVVMRNSIRDSDPLSVARAEAAAAPSFAVLEREHAAVWAGYWRDCDVEVKGDRVVQTMARFWVFHLLQAACGNNVSLKLSASIPAKALSGWGYGGRIFWDTEIYMLPFFSQQYPEIAESLLRYRHDRLPAARLIAARSGCAGIKFPWESGSDGAEECPKWCSLRGTNELERWRGGEQQIHINADVAYAFWQHALATGDRAFLMGPGLDILVGTARYWASRVRAQKHGEAFEIRLVIGPDESHQSVHNNLYTNALARWNLRQAADLVDALARHPAARRAELRKLGVAAGEPASWRRIADRIKINFNPQSGLYEQFDGYFKHPEQTIKQADALLALFLMPEMRPGDVFRKNFDRYYPVTEHGSSLSPCMHVLFALELGDMRKACEYERQSCEVDGVFKPGGTDKGLHAASLGGGWSSIVAGFGGVRVTPDFLDVAPRLPKKWQRLAFSIRYRGLRLRFRMGQRKLVILAEASGPSVNLRVLGQRIRIRAGQRLERRIFAP